MFSRTRVAGLVCVLIVGSGCASYRGPIPVDRKICMAVAAGGLGALGGHVANKEEYKDSNTVWGWVVGGTVGAATGYLLCGKPAEPLAPTARASADPSSGEAPLTVRFSGTASDPDGQIVRYDWDFGDGSRGTGTQPSHTYRSPGSYQARLTVTDDDGLTGAGSVAVRVTETAAAAPPPPVSRRIVLRGVNFAFDSAEITGESEVILDTAVEALKESPDVRIEVAGHTDSTGPDAYNQGLSERRANAVASYLTGQGIDRSRLSVVGHGESSPVATNDTRDGRAQNRRVELNVQR